MLHGKAVCCGLCPILSGVGVQEEDRGRHGWMNKLTEGKEVMVV